MILRSWLASLFSRIATSKVQHAKRGRRARQLPAAMHVESLERRQMLTFTINPQGAISLNEEATHFPYPAWNEPVGTAVGSVSFTDTDSTGTAPNIIFAVKNNDIQIIGGNPSEGAAGAAFAVTGTGAITINNPSYIDASAFPSFTLTFQETDNQGNVATGTVTINLQTVYQPPVIPQFPYQNDTFDGVSPPHSGPTEITEDNSHLQANTGDDVSSNSNYNVANVDIKPTGVGVNLLRVKENSGAGTVVGTVYAGTPDRNQTDGFHSTLTYTFQGAVPGFDSADPAISIDPFTGIIRVLDPAFFNYEALRTPNASEGDLGEGHVFSDGAGGSVRVPDVTLAVQVRVTDISGAPNDFSQTHQPTGGTTTDSFVYIRVLDVGEIPPDVSQATANMSVNEGTNPFETGASINGTSVGFFDMIAGVPDFFNGAPPDFYVASGSGNSVRIAKPASAIGLSTIESQQRYSYTIVGGNGTGSGAFAINKDTGEVTVNDSTQINYEKFNDYTLEIAVSSDNQDADFLGTVQDVAPLTTVASLHIHVNDVLEQVTVFSPLVNPNVPGDVPFSIPEGSANGTVVGSVNVDRSGAVPVAVPGAIAVYDDDMTLPNGKGSLTYSIVSGNSVTIGGVQYNGIFAIDPTTGVLTVNNVTTLSNAAVLSYLNQQVFEVTVQVQDRGDTTTEGNAAIEIDLKPVDSTPPSVTPGFATLREYTGVSVADPTNGSAVGQVVAAAGQSDFQILPNSYSFVSGNTVTINGTVITPFKFSTTTPGLILINDVTGLDFEIQPVFNLVVQVTDNGQPKPLSATGTFTVTLINENDPITIDNKPSNLNYSLNENSPTGFLVGTIGTTDEDNLNGPVQGQFFTINGGDTGGAFAIDAQGHITVANASAVDYEVNPTFSLSVTVTDTGVPATSDSKTINITLVNVNDAPVVNNATFNINEHSLAGFVVGTVVATDEDRPAQTLTYAITAGNIAPGGVPFAIDPATGVITVTDPGLIDYVKTQQFTLTVTVTDNGYDGPGNPAFAPMSGTGTIHVVLKDVTEPQLADQTVSIPENSPNDGTVIATAVVTHDPVGPFTYSIVGGNTNLVNGQTNAFSIVATGPNAGQITVNNPLALDFETQPTFALKVLVVDSQPQPLGDTATITVNLTNVNEAPILSGIENTPLNYIEKGVTPITATLVASDPDSTSSIPGSEAQSATIQITGNYLNGQDTLVFTNTPNITGTWVAATGTLTLTGTDTFANYQAALRSVEYKNLSFNPSVLIRTVSYTITDNGTPGLTSNTVTRNITVTPVNDPPVLSSIEVAPLAYTEGNITAITGAIQASDVDSTNAQGATIQITGNYLNGQDQLDFTNTATITGVWTAATGTLTLSGLDTFVNYQAALRSVEYQNLSQNPSVLVRTVSFTITDSGALPSNTVARTITITPVNNPPILSGLESAPLTYTESVNSFATTPLTATIIASDPDSVNAQGATIQITGNYRNGQDQLNFTNTANITGTWNPANGTLTLSGIDSFTNYRAALRSVTYENLSHNPSVVARTVSFTITDDSGAPSNTVSRNITVVPVNNPPILSSSILNVAYTEGTGAQSINPAIAVSDPDSTTLASGTVTLTNYNVSEDVLGFVANPATMGNIIINSNANGVLSLVSLGATATLTQWQAAFRAVTYTNVSGDLAPPARTFTFVANDGSAVNNISNTFTSGINITPIFPPVLAGTNNKNYTEKTAPIAIDSGITISDQGTPTLASATIKISNFVAGQDVLGFVPNAGTMGNIAIQSNSGNVLTLTSSGGTATLAQWQAALRAVTYSNSSFNPSTATRAVTFQVNNGRGVNQLSNVLTTNVSITAVNNAPVLSGIETTPLSYVELSLNVNVSSSIVASDVDSPNMSGATVQITGNYKSNQDSLQFTNTSNITGTFNPANGMLTLSGLDTVANYNAALRSITYFDSSNNPSALTRTVTFTVIDDGGLPSNSVTRNITVVPVNNPPSLSGIETTALQYFENTPPNYSVNNTTPVSLTVQASDPDSLNMSGATIQITGNYLSNQDQLVFTNTAKITASWNSSTGTLTLSGTDTLANYTAALESVSYYNRQDNPSSVTRTVTFTVIDDGGLPSNSVTRNISVIPVNDPPVLTAQDAGPLFYSEDSGAKLIVPSVLATDPDSTNLMGATVQITGNYNYNNSKDMLFFTNTANITGNWNAATGTLTLSGIDSVSNYRTALRSISFSNQHDGLVPVTRTVSFTVTDDSGLSGNTITRFISITHVNEASILSGIETTPHIYKANDPYTPATPITSSLVVTDYDSATLTGATIQITGNYIAGQDRLGFSLAGTNISGSLNTTTGTLTLSGVDSVAHYQAALQSVVYTNISATPNTATRTISFQVTDNTALKSNIVTRNVTIVTTNTPPSVSLNAPGPLVYTEGDPATPIVPNATVTDPDSPNIQGATIKITGNYQPGQDSLVFTSFANIITAGFNTTTATLVLTGSNTLANYQTALEMVKYVNNSQNPSSATRTVSFVVSDGLSSSTVVTQSITVIPVDSPPQVLTNASGPLAYMPANGAVAIAPGLTVTDPDNTTLVGATVQISFNYQRGNDVLSFINTSKITGTFNAGTGILTLSGTDTVSNYRAALQSVKYAFLGTAVTSTKTITFVASDGTLQSTAVTRNINVSP